MSEDKKIEQPELTEEMQAGLQHMVVWSGELVITENADRIQAIEGLKRVKVRAKAIKKWFAPSRNASHKAWKSIVAQEKDVTAVLDEIERKAKAAIIKYDNAEEKKRHDEQVRLQAIADKQARIDRERLLKESAKLKTPELKEERLEQAEQVIAPIVQVVKVEKVAGASTRKIWKARIVDADIIPREWMVVNEKALNAFVKSTKGAVKIAGVEFYSESQLAVRV